jgi:arylsulfatase A-like enzyme
MTGYVSNSSWTRPSYTTILTGQPKRVHGVELNGHKLSDDVETLAERFAEAGYRTASFVGNPLVGADVGYSQGFEVYVDTKTMGRMFPSDEALVDRAIRWLAREDPRPFFLVVFLTAPHAPYRPHLGYRRFLEEVPGGRIIERPRREYRQPLPAPDRDRIVAAYDGEVAFADAQVGRLIDFLAAEGALPRTTVLVTADHGEAFGEHNCYTHTYHMWEPVLLVPFVLVAPEIGSKNVRDDRPYTHIDIAPTLLDLAGVDYSGDELPGISIARVLRGTAEVDRERLVFSQYDAHGVRREAVRKGRWKLVHHHAVPKSAASRLNDLSQGSAPSRPRDLPSLAWDGERYELYDLVADPEERRNVYDENSGSSTLRDLRRGMESSLRGTTVSGPLSEETMRVLTAMGYMRSPTDAEEPANRRR